MKYPEIKCCYCGSTDTHVWKLERCSIYSDDIRKMLFEQFGDRTSLSNRSDNIIYRAKCNCCDKYFSAMFRVNIDVREVVVKEESTDFDRVGS